MYSSSAACDTQGSPVSLLVASSLPIDGLCALARPGLKRPISPWVTRSSREQFRLTGMPWCPGRTVESLIRIAAKWAISQVLGCGYAGICARALSQLPRCAYLLATGFPIIAMRRIVKWRTRVRTCVSHVDHELQGSIPLQGIE